MVGHINTPKILDCYLNYDWSECVEGLEQCHECSENKPTWYAFWDDIFLLKQFPENNNDFKHGHMETGIIISIPLRRYYDITYSAS